MGDRLREALRLVFVTPGSSAPSVTAERILAACQGGVTAVLLREPQLDPGERTALAHRIRELTGTHDVALLVSRDAELARRVGADGVHAGWGGAPLAELRAQAPGTWVGRSAHWPLQSEDRDADYVTLSPFAPTHRSHARPLLTAEQVRAVLGEPELGPVVALGGLDVAAIAALPAGLAGVAVMRAVADADDPRAAARSLRDAWSARSRVLAEGAEDAGAPA